MNQGDDIFPISGTKKTKYLEENMRALNVELTSEKDKQIRQAIERPKCTGRGFQKR